MVPAGKPPNAEHDADVLDATGWRYAMAAPALLCALAAQAHGIEGADAAKLAAN